MEQKQIYKCGVCGNMVEVLIVGGGELTCCGQPMTLMTENTVDASKEKHVPVIEKTAHGYKVTVGGVLHPMQDAHYIMFIELIADGRIYRKFLKPGDEPVAEFNISASSVVAREYCNLHGLWKSQI